MSWGCLYNLFKRSRYSPIDKDKITLENGKISVNMLKRDILCPEKHRDFSSYEVFYYNTLAELSDKEVEQAYRAYLSYLQRVEDLRKLASEPYEEYYKKVMGREYAEG